jgi:acyl-CoA hydrolase
VFGSNIQDISLAHPDFREELERQAFEHRLMPRAFFMTP